MFYALRTPQGGHSTLVEFASKAGLAQAQAADPTIRYRRMDALDARAWVSRDGHHETALYKDHEGRIRRAEDEDAESAITRFRDAVNAQLPKPVRLNRDEASSPYYELDNIPFAEAVSRTVEARLELLPTMTTQPKVVVMQNGSSLKVGAQYLQQDGSFGDYKTARRFASDAAAEPFCEPGGHGIFPCSVPRRRRR